MYGKLRDRQGSPGGNMKPSETAPKVVDLGTAIRDYWNAELPKRHANYPVVSRGEDSGPSPPQEAELRNFLENLTDDEIYKPVLLMNLGRGDFGTAELATHYQIIKDRFRKRERAISQLAGKASLADYVADGMNELKTKGIDVDELTFSPVAAGK